jgi:biotin carboxyl carrier protein
VRYAVTIVGQTVEVDVDGEHFTIGGRRFSASLEVIQGTPLRQLLVDGRPETLVVESIGRGRWGLQVAGERWDVEVLDERTRHIRSLTGANDQPRSIQVLTAPMPGLVVRVLARPGEPIAAGSGVVVLEAMKMENELRAAGSAVVKAVRVEPGQVVEKGQVLVEFEAGR